MTTDAETIASLRAELAELGVRIGAPDSVADLRSAAHRTWRIASLLQREHKELRAALLAMEHRATTAEATVAALMAGAAEEFAVLRDAAVADAAAVCERMAQGHDRIAAASSPVAEERHKGVVAALRLAADRVRALAPQPPSQRPETARDVATPAPDAPSPAGGLPVAAAGVCAACRGSGRVLYAREVEDGCDECEATGRVAMMVDATAATWCPRCDGSGRHLHEGHRVVRCDECRTTGRVVAEVGR